MYNYRKVQKMPISDAVSNYLELVNKRMIRMYVEDKPLQIELTMWGTTFNKNVYFSNLYKRDWDLLDADITELHEHLSSWRKSLAIEVARKLWNFLPREYLGHINNPDEPHSPTNHLVLEIDNKYVDYVRQGNLAFWLTVPDKYARDVILWAKERHIFIQTEGSADTDTNDVAYTYLHKELYQNVNDNQIGWKVFKEHLVEVPVSETLPFHKFSFSSKSLNKLEKFQFEKEPLRFKPAVCIHNWKAIHKPFKL